MDSLLKIVSNKSNFHFRASGSSMNPLLHDQDIVYLKRTKSQVPKINDIVLVNKNDTNFIHRLIYESPQNSGTKKYFVTKGDHRITSDEKLDLKDIIGNVLYIKRGNQIINLNHLYLIQSTLYFQEILKVKKEFENYEINFVFLKGLPLHLYYEGSHPKRIYADCDILLENKEIQKINRIFINLGYKKAHTEYSKIHSLLKNKLTEISYYKHVNNFPIIFDVHFEPVFMMNQIGRLDEIYPQKLINEMTRIFLSEKKIISIKGEKLPILSPVNLFMYLSLHLFHHNFHEVFRLSLIRTVINKHKLFLSTNYVNKLQEVTEKLKINNYLYPTLLLLRKYYATSVPIKLVKSLKPEDKKMDYILHMIDSINIFDGEDRIKAGITRFRNLFYLSPQPIYRKLTIIFNISFLYSFQWTVSTKLILLIRLFFGRLNRLLIR